MRKMSSPTNRHERWSGDSRWLRVAAFWIVAILVAAAAVVVAFRILANSLTAVGLSPAEQAPLVGARQEPGWQPRNIPASPGSVEGGLNGAAGKLDATFGALGVVRTSLGGTALVSALVAQPDGKVVAAGQVTWPQGAFAHGDPSDFALVRYQPDGSLDTSFGSGGGVVTDFEGGYDELSALVLQSDGKLVASGWSGRTGTVLSGAPATFALARYTPDGALDQEFGESGRVMTSVGKHDEAKALLLQPDGKLVVAGTTYRTTPRFWEGGQYAIAIVRYLPDGRLDPTFGTGGQVVVSFGLDEAEGFALASQPDGKLIVAGRARVVRGGNLAFVLARFAPDGSPDASFGTGGFITTEFDGNAGASAVAVQPGSKLLAAGQVGGSVVLARYMPDGSLDTQFGHDGRLALGVSSVARALTLDGAGRPVLAGRTGGSLVLGAADFLILRLTPDGRPDDSFASDGRMITNLGVDQAEARAVLVLPDGKLLVGGFMSTKSKDPSNYGGDADFGLVRLRGGLADL